MRTILFSLILTLLSLASVTYANSSGVVNQGVHDYFVPLVGLPFVTSKQPTFQELITAFYRVAISVAAFLAVGRILIAGVKYMLTDVVSTKGKARNDIRSSLVGLLIVVGAVLILNTINPNLTHTNVLQNAPIPKVAELQTAAPNICQAAPNSKACCDIQGGTYVITNNGSSCTNGSAGIKITGNATADKLTCQTAGGTWNPKLNPPCRTAPAQYLDVPPIYKNFNLNLSNPADYSKLNTICATQIPRTAKGGTWSYDAAKQKCVNTTG